MASQIEQLRSHFKGLNNTQKKAFIDNLKVKLQGSKNAEYMAFLNDCIKSYNEEVKKINKNTLASTPKTVQASQASRVVATTKKSSNTIDDIAKKATGIVGNIKEELETSETVGKFKDNVKKGKHTKKIIFAVIAVICVVFAFNFISGMGNKDKVVGTWETGSGTSYTFNPNGTFSYSYRSYSATLGGTQSVSYSGKYSVSGNKITINIDYDTIRGGGYSGLKSLEAYENGERSLKYTYNMKFDNDKLTFISDGEIVYQLSKK